MKLLEQVLLHQENEAAICSWQAYGWGILLRKDDELYACRQDGGNTEGKKTTLLVNYRRDDSATIGREWRYVPYAKGAIFYECSRRLGHEGMEIDRRETITAYADDGSRKKLYDSGDQYIFCGQEWLVYKNGIMLAENGHYFHQKPEEQRKEREFQLIQDDGTKRLFYRGKAAGWRTYGGGILLWNYDSSHNFFSSCDEAGKIQNLGEIEKADYWDGYGRGLLLGKEDGLWAFRVDEKNAADGKKAVLFRGRCKEQEYKPCSEGIMMRQESRLLLCRDDGTQEIVYDETTEGRIKRSEERRVG